MNRGIAGRITPLSQILPGKIDWRVKVRVINLWCLPEFKNPADNNSIEMIWLDEQCGKIHATVKKALITKFQNVLEEGAAYFFQNLLVAQNDPKFKTTNHKYKLTFIGTTTCVKTDAEHIPRNHFDFAAFKDIIAATKEDKLIDVIGHIVEKGNIKETEKNGTRTKLIDIVLQDLECDTVHCTLWADFAEKVQQYLDNHESDCLVILILQLGKLKKFHGIMGVSNAFFGTKVLLNADISQVKEYRENMDHSQSQLTQVVSQMTGQTSITLHEDFMQTPMMTISDLYESREKCFGSLLATIIELETEKGWYYDACSKCMKRVSTVGSKYYCEKCKKPVTAVASFKVQVTVIDRTGSATFILFDRVMSSYLDKSAKEILQSIHKSSENTDLPQDLKILLNKLLLFKVEVSDGNIYENWQSFTVKKMTADKEIVQQFMEKFNIQEHQYSVGEQNDGSDALNNDKETSAVEFGDSNNKIDGGKTDVEETPSNKTSGKRTHETVEAVSVIDLGDTQASTTKAPKVTTKAPKMTRVKTEKLE